MTKQEQALDELQKLLLHAEQLDVSKKQVQVGNVTLRKKVVTELKAIIVPLSREELVIEVATTNEGEETQAIRIPISEEQAEIVKHPKAIQDVSISTQSFEELRHIEEKLQREVLQIETLGQAVLIDETNL